MQMQAPALTHHIKQKQRLLLIVLGIIGAVLVVFVMIGLLFGKKDLQPLITKVTAQQEEILRVNELAEKFQPALATRHLQASVAAVIASDLQGIRTQLKSSPDKEALAAYTDPKVEERFQSAAQRNALDGEYRTTLRTLIEQNRASLRELAAQSKSKDASLLNIVDGHYELLLEQFR